MKPYPLLLAVLFCGLLLPACSPAKVTSIPHVVTLTISPLPGTETPVPATLSAPQVSAPQFALLRMIDVSHGWAVTPNALLRTADGGVTWYDVSMNGVSDGLDTTSSFFLDADRAWILIADASGPLSGGTLFHTKDGGVSWTSTAVPFGGGILDFLDPSQGWIMADRGMAAGSMAVAIYQTRDGGQNWEQVYANDPNLADSADSLPFSGDKTGFTSVDMQHAWVSGTVPVNNAIYLYGTSDGGRTWFAPKLSMPDGVGDTQVISYGPQFFSQQDGLFFTLMYGNINKLYIYVTHDSGQTWTPTTTPVPNGGAADFISIDDGFVWDSNQFYITHDGGDTWSKVLPNVSFGQDFAAMDFVTTKVGWVIVSDSNGKRALYKTTNGGLAWDKISP